MRSNQARCCKGRRKEFDDEKEAQIEREAGEERERHVTHDADLEHQQRPNEAGGEHTAQPRAASGFRQDATDPGGRARPDPAE